MHDHRGAGAVGTGLEPGSTGSTASGRAWKSLQRRSPERGGVPPGVVHSGQGGGPGEARAAAF